MVLPGISEMHHTLYSKQGIMSLNLMRGKKLEALLCSLPERHHKQAQSYAHQIDLLTAAGSRLAP